MTAYFYIMIALITYTGAYYSKVIYINKEVDAVKRGPKLNLIKNFGKGGGGVTLQL